MQFLKVEFHSTKPMPYGMNAFEYPATDPRFNNVFNNGMLNHTTIVMKKILETYKGFEGLEEVVDVGGGVGATLNAIISRYPHIKGINYDLPHVVAGAPALDGRIVILYLFPSYLYWK